MSIVAPSNHNTVTVTRANYQIVITEEGSGLTFTVTASQDLVTVRQASNIVSVSWGKPSPPVPEPPVLTGDKLAWFTIIAEFSGYHEIYVERERAANPDWALNAVYYGAEDGAYYLADIFANTVTYYERADLFNLVYAVTYGRGNGWAIPGYWCFGETLEQRYIRRADPNALSDLQSLCANAAYHVSGTLSATPSLRHELSREWSYAVLDLMALKNVFGLTEAQQARLDYCANDLLTICNDWTTGVASYCRPFMPGIAAHALIRYYETEASEAEKTAIRTALKAIASYLWTSCWNESGQAFNYTDRDIGQAEDLLPAPDLSMLVAPLYAWLWSVTGNADWKTKAETIFQGAIPVYDEYGFWQSGAYLGTRNDTNPNGKHIDQQLVWHKYFDYVEITDPVIEIEPPVITVEPANQSVTEPAAATFTVTATGTAPLTYQWKRGGVDIGGATSSSYTTAATTAASDNGAAYSVVVTNAAGSDTSANATLTVAAAGFDPSTIGTILHWLDATAAAKNLDAGGAAASDAEAVDTNVDSGLSGVDVQQTTDAYRPICQTNEVNGLQVLRFDGGDGFPLTDAQSGTITRNRTGLTIAFTIKPTNFDVARRIARFDAPSGGAERLLIVLRETGGLLLNIRPQDAGTVDDEYTTALTAGAWNVVVIKLDFAGNAAKVWVNGSVALTSANIGSTGNSSDTAPTSGGDGNHLFFNFYGSGGIVADITDWIVADGAAADVDCETLSTNLLTRLGL